MKLVKVFEKMERSGGMITGLRERKNLLELDTVLIVGSVFLALFQHFYFIGLLMKSIFFCFSFLGVGVLFKV